MDDELARLYDVAEDWEAETLDRLRERAGITWEHHGCWTNQGSDKACARCGLGRRACEAQWWSHAV